MAKHTEVLSQLHDTKQALAASEKRSKRDRKQLNEIKSAMKPVLKNMKFWAESQLQDEANAARVITVGECRNLWKLLSEEQPVETETQESESAAA